MPQTIRRQAESPSVCPAGHSRTSLIPDARRQDPIGCGHCVSFCQSARLDLEYMACPGCPRAKDEHRACESAVVISSTTFAKPSIRLARYTSRLGRIVHKGSLEGRMGVDCSLKPVERVAALCFTCRVLLLDSSRPVASICGLMIVRCRHPAVRSGI